MTRLVLRPLAHAAALALAAAPLAAQQAKLPPVRQLGPVTARSSEPLGSVATAVPLPGGKVLVNDILNRRVVMFDSTLANVTVVADTTGATANAYGARGGGLIGYGGDSALFIDPASLSMMVVNANGELTTVRAVPRANEIALLAGGPNGRPGFDPQGRLVYRGMARGRPRQEARGARQAGVGGPGGMTFNLPEQPDSAPVVRVDLETRALDTLATFRIPKVDIKVSQGADGRMNVQTTVNPMPVTDDWALLADGTIALVRGHDFHVDWRAPDGTITSSPKLPFEWQRLTDEDKAFVLDSARTAMEKLRAETQARMQAAGGPAAFISGGGAERTMIMMGPGGGAPPQRGAAAAGGAQGGGAQGGRGPGGQGGPGGPGGPGGFQIPPVNMVNASELPDYRPPFGQQSALGDLDGHLWIRTTAPQGEAGPIYYVVARPGEVVDRVQLPQGRMIAGFGKGGLIYLSFRDTEGNTRVEVARWK